MNLQILVFIILLIILVCYFLFYITNDFYKIENNKVYTNKLYNSKIPKTIIQTSKYKLNDDYTNTFQKKISGWEYKHFTDIQIEEFFNKNKLKEFENIISVFKKLKRGEHKADLFRYYYLYINGGVYIDSDIMIYKHIEDIIKNYEFISMKNKFRNFITNAFIAVTPKHNIMYLALKDAYNVNHEKLNSNYNLLCENLNNIINSNNIENYYLYTEYINKYLLEGYSYCLDEQNDKKIILKHYSHFAYKNSIPLKYLH